MFQKNPEIFENDMTPKDFCDSLERLNKQEIEREDQIVRSKQYLIGASVLRYGKSILRLNLAQLIRDLGTRRNSKLAAKIRISPTVLPKKSFNNDSSTSRIAVYTCVTGNYDFIVPPLVHFSNVDYYLYVDNIDEFKQDNGAFIVKQIPTEILGFGNVLANRYVKMHPEEFLKGYDYTIYMDGNIQVVSDIREFVEHCPAKTGIAMHTHRERDCVFEEAKMCTTIKRGESSKIIEQMSRYFYEGMPLAYGLNEAGVIVAKSGNEVAKKLLKQWWEEFSASESLRDQLAWPYILWKNGFMLSDIGNLGCNIMKNYKLRVTKHY